MFLRLNSIWVPHWWVNDCNSILYITNYFFRFLNMSTTTMHSGDVRYWQGGMMMRWHDDGGGQRWLMTMRADNEDMVMISFFLHWIFHWTNYIYNNDRITSILCILMTQNDDNGPDNAICIIWVLNINFNTYIQASSWCIRKTWSCIPCHFHNDIDNSNTSAAATSVLKSSPVQFFALQGLRPKPRPVLQIPEAAKNRTGPWSSVFCDSRTDPDWSLTSLNRSSGVQEVTQQIYFMYFMYEI